MAITGLNTILNTVMSPQTGIVYSSQWISGIYVDVIESHLHERKAEVAQQVLENGATIADHIVLKPITLTITFSQTNQAKAGESGMERSRKVFQELEDLWRNRGLLTIWTEHKQYNDMVIESISSEQRAPHKGALSFSAKLVQINSVKIETTKVSAIQINGVMSTSGSSTVERGEDQATKVDNRSELLKKIQEQYNKFAPQYLKI